MMTHAKTFVRLSALAFLCIGLTACTRDTPSDPEPSDDTGGMVDTGTDVREDTQTTSDTGGLQDATDTGESADTGGSDTAAPDTGPPEDTTDAGDTADTGTPEGDPAQGSWSDDYFLPGLQGGSGARAYTVKVGPDGDVFAGGRFEYAGPTPASNIARWDGTQWHPLGDGPGVSVEAIAFLSNGNLLVGGRTSGTTGDLKLWDGSSWSTFASVSDDSIGSISDLVRLPNGDLLVAGNFDQIAGNAIANLAVHSEGQWEPVASSQPDNTVETVEPTGPDTFCIGGTFDNIGSAPSRNVACWDGTAWTTYAKGLPGTVHALHVYDDGRILAGGTFTFNTGPGRRDYLAGLAMLDGGRWRPHAGGVDGGAVNNVRTLSEGPDGAIYVGGTFTLVGKRTQDLDAMHVAKLKDGTWSRLEEGLANDVGAVLPAVEGVYDIAIRSDGSTVAGGLFTVSGSTPALNVAEWDGSAWSSLADTARTYLGISGFVNVLETTGVASLVAGGKFNAAGSAEASNVAHLESGEWSEPGKGLAGDISALATSPSGDLYAAGSFIDAGILDNTDFLAMWNGTDWEASWPNPNGPVTALAFGPEGSIYIGGRFTKVGQVDAKRVAKWDGSSWHALGKGFDAEATSLAYDPASETLYAAGLFQGTGGNLSSSLDHVAKWDGSEWSPLGGGTSGYVSEMTLHDGEVYVAGNFEKAGRKTVHSIARWDGSSWNEIGNGVPSDNGPTTTLSALEVHADGIFISGSFEKIGDQTFNHLAWWNGQEWRPLGDGLNDMAEDLDVRDNQLHIGGIFTRAGSTPSYGMALWDYRP